MLVCMHVRIRTHVGVCVCVRTRVPRYMRVTELDN